MLDELGTLHQALAALLELTVADESDHSYVSSAVCLRYTSS